VVHTIFFFLDLGLCHTPIFSAHVPARFAGKRFATISCSMIAARTSPVNLALAAATSSCVVWPWRSGSDC